MRSEVEIIMCDPVIEGPIIRCEIWDNNSGGMHLYNGYGDNEVPNGWDLYSMDRKKTFDHAFSVFYSRSGDIDFVADVCIDWHVAGAKRVIYYSENGKVCKKTIEKG